MSSTLFEFRSKNFIDFGNVVHKTFYNFECTFHSHSFLVYFSDCCPWNRRTFGWYLQWYSFHRLHLHFVSGSIQKKIPHHFSHPLLFWWNCCSLFFFWVLAWLEYVLVVVNQLRKCLPGSIRMDGVVLIVNFLLLDVTSHQKCRPCDNLRNNRDMVFYGGKYDAG